MVNCMVWYVVTRQRELVSERSWKLFICSKCFIYYHSVHYTVLTGNHCITIVERACGFPVSDMKGYGFNLCVNCAWHSFSPNGFILLTVNGICRMQKSVFTVKELKTKQLYV